MTIIDAIESLPPVIGIVLKFLFLIWAIEMFFFPFKFNILHKRTKDIEEILRDILNETGTNKIAFEDTQRILSILLRLQDKSIKKKKEKE